jgi:hypothetical protein
MSDKQVITLLFAVPFDHPLFMELDLLGYAQDIVMDGNAGRIEFPQSRDPAGNLALRQPMSASATMKAHLQDGWGLQPERMAYAEVNAVLLAFPVSAQLDRSLREVQLGGGSMREIVDKVTSWFESLVHWLWVLTAQALDPMNPDPKVLHRKSRNMIVAASASGEFSLNASAMPAVASRLDIDNPTSERLLTRKLLAGVLPSVGSAPPPLMWELLTAAKMAGRRGDARRALIDAGTAAESALTVILSLSPGHILPLGGLVAKAARRGVTLPSDTRSALVQPRNDAIHRGRWSGAAVNRALEISEELVARADASFVQSTRLESVNRPQRADIQLILPPRSVPGQ